MPPLILALALAILFSACSPAHRDEPTASPAQVPLPERVGWLDGPCLAIANSGLRAGDAVTLVLLDESQSIGKATVAGPAATGSECRALRDDRRKGNQVEGQSFYRLTLSGGGPIRMGVGVVGENSTERVVEGVVRADVDDDGSEESFNACATSEGIRFRILSDRGEERWSGYYYLGYDLEPNCPS